MPNIDKDRIRIGFDNWYRPTLTEKQSIIVYLCYSPLNKRPTSDTGSVHFLKVVVRIAEVLGQHDFTDIVPKQTKMALS